MANIRSSKKSIRKTAKVTVRRKAEKSRMKTASKKLKVVKKSGNAEKTKSAAKALMSIIDKAKKHGVVHKNKANRMKSRLSSLILPKVKKEADHSVKAEASSAKNEVSKKEKALKKAVAKAKTRSKAAKK